MTGIEIMEICKKQIECEKCPCKKECREWRRDKKDIEPWELGKILNEKEY